MNTHYLSSLFTPDSVVLFGASSRPDAVGGVVLRNLLESGFRGSIYPVNPKRNEVQGRKAYPSLSDVEGQVDLAVVATPALTIPGIVAACGERGIRTMLILSGGFREIGKEGSRLENQIMRCAREYGIRIMGPSCLGIIRPDIGLNATFGNGDARAGNLALVSQSGAVCTSILDWAESNAVGFSAVVSTGFSTDLDIGDYLDYLATDPKTHAILLYVEGITHARRFMSSLRTAARIKPVISLKAGRHAVNAEASMSHTGSPVGSDETFSSALSRSGVLRVSRIGQLFAAARVLASSNYKDATQHPVILTNGGGPGIIAADRTVDQGIELATLSDETKSRLDGILPPVWSRGNPVDILGDAGPKRYQQALDICLDDPGVDGAIVILAPQAMTRPTDVAEAVIASASGSKKPVITSWMGGVRVERSRELFAASGIPSFRTVENAVDGFSYLAQYNCNQRLVLQTPARRASGQSAPDREGARLIIEGVLSEQRKVLTEAESFAVLTAFGVPTIRHGVAHSANEALVIAESIGFPVAMRVLSGETEHVSDADSVRININSAREVRSAYRQLVDQATNTVTDASIYGIVVKKMYCGPTSRETMVGIVSDPVFGPVIRFGSGGKTVEVLDDTAVSLPPLNHRLSHDLIERTRASRLLPAFRNMPAADTERLVDVLLNVSCMACELPWITEMNINPLMVDDYGAVALDARIVVDHPKLSTNRYHHLAIHPYPSDRVNKVQLNDGTNIVIRPIRPEDAASEAKFIRELSNESKYFRFMNTFREPSQKMLVRFTQIDYHNEMALVAKVPDRDEQIGVARYATNPDNTSCEFALVVSDHWRRRGIARHLMTDLIKVARDRGLNVMVGQVLANNFKMLRLISSLGFSVSDDPEDDSLKNVELRLHARQQVPARSDHNLRLAAIGAA